MNKLAIPARDGRIFGSSKRLLLCFEERNEQLRRSKDDYNSCTYLGPDDETRAAEKRLQKKMDMDWRTFDNNCQEYVDTVAKDPELVESRIQPDGVATVRKK